MKSLGTAYGVDGCGAGWFFIALESSGKVKWGTVSKVAELVRKAEESDSVFVDIPIGLPDGTEERLCDKEARRRLGFPRSASVFRAPVREALSSESYEEAKQISREATGKALTKQTYAIMPKIREVSTLLRGCGKARHIVREVHPEICFWALAGKEPMAHSKKKRKGLDERLAVLESVHPFVGENFEKVRESFSRKEVASDDIVDAMAAAITASADREVLRTLPKNPLRDDCNLPMEMVYAAQTAFAT